MLPSGNDAALALAAWGGKVKFGGNLNGNTSNSNINSNNSNNNSINISDI
jgi:hypothetical protein